MGTVTYSLVDQGHCVNFRAHIMDERGSDQEKCGGSFAEHERQQCLESRALSCVVPKTQRLCTESGMLLSFQEENAPLA